MDALNEETVADRVPTVRCREATLGCVRVKRHVLADRAVELAKQSTELKKHLG
mgnify:CR=1 FL=1